MPTKYLIKPLPNVEAELNAYSEFDKMMNQVKISEMLLERLKKEFDENLKVAARSNESNNNK